MFLNNLQVYKLKQKKKKNRYQNLMWAPKLVFIQPSLLLVQRIAIHVIVHHTVMAVLPSTCTEYINASATFIWRNYPRGQCTGSLGFYNTESEAIKVEMCYISILIPYDCAAYIAGHTRFVPMYVESTSILYICMS